MGTGESSSPGRGVEDGSCGREREPRPEEKTASSREEARGRL